MPKKKRYRVRVTQRVVEEGFVEVMATSARQALGLAPAACQFQDAQWKYAFAEDEAAEAWEAKEVKNG